MKKSLFLLNPIWYAPLVLLFFVSITGETFIVDNVWPVNQAAEWLANHGRSAGLYKFSAQQLPPSFAVKVKALSLVLLPFASLGTFLVFWRVKDNFVNYFVDRNQKPPAFVELAGLVILFGGAYVNYFLDPRSKCALCPTYGTWEFSAMEAGILFTLSLMPVTTAMHVYARIYIYAVGKNLPKA